MGGQTEVSKLATKQCKAKAHGIPLPPPPPGQMLVMMLTSIGLILTLPKFHHLASSKINNQVLFVQTGIMLDTDNRYPVEKCYPKKLCNLPVKHVQEIEI